MRPSAFSLGRIETAVVWKQSGLFPNDAYQVAAPIRTLSSGQELSSQNITHLPTATETGEARQRSSLQSSR